MSGTTDDAARRRWLVIVVVAVVVVIAAVLFIVLRPTPQGSGALPTSSPSATRTGSAAASPGPQDTPTPLPTDEQFGEPIADETPPDAVADFGDGVTARIASVAVFTSEASQPGEIAGPAVRVTLEITNGTGSPVSLDEVTVNAYVGDVPASPIDSDPSNAPFSGRVDGGATASGAYVFSAAGPDGLVVTVSRGAGIPIIVFR